MSPLGVILYFCFASALKIYTNIHALESTKNTFCLCKLKCQHSKKAGKERSNFGTLLDSFIWYSFLHGLMSIDINLEVTKNIFYAHFVTRNLFWVLRDGRILVCPSISFVTLEVHSFPYCLPGWGSKDPLIFLVGVFCPLPGPCIAVVRLGPIAMWSYGEVHRASHTSILPQKCAGCSLAARHWGQCEQPQ